MAIRGRKPKPSHLKLVTGNPGKRAINTQEPAPERILPQPPGELTAEARGEWDRVAGELNRLGLLTGQEADFGVTWKTKRRCRLSQSMTLGCLCVA